MTKKFIFATLAIATLFTTSCKKDETCAKCELREYCVRCEASNGSITENCGTEQQAETFEGDCTIMGGSVTTSNSISDTQETCDEKLLVVDSFIDAREVDGYRCEYVD